MSYTVTLSNGKAFTGLQVNGTCFTSKQPVTADMFANGLNPVRIQAIGDDAQNESPYGLGEIRGLELGGVFECDGEYFFFFTQLTPEQKEALSARADIEYIAMMTGVEL